MSIVGACSLFAFRVGRNGRPRQAGHDPEEVVAGVLARILRPSYGVTMALVPTRAELPALLNRRGLVGEGVEIGVKLGFFSELLLDGWNGRRLISVDPWLSDDPDRYVDSGNVGQDEQEEYFRTTQRRLKRFGARSEIWRMTSVEAAARVPDVSLDLAYIDARHDYESVSEDLALWFAKIRPGGVFAGHDYVDGTFPEAEFGVRSAVDEFFGARGLPVFATYQDAPWISWLVTMPGSNNGRSVPPPVELAARTFVLGIRAAVTQARTRVRRAGRMEGSSPGGDEHAPRRAA